MFAEDTDEVIREVGIDDARLLDLKYDGAITRPRSCIDGTGREGSALYESAG